MRRPLILRLTLTQLGLLDCYRLMVSSAKAGYSRLLSTVSIVQSGIDPAAVFAMLVVIAISDVPGSRRPKLS